MPYMTRTGALLPKWVPCAQSTKHLKALQYWGGVSMTLEKMRKGLTKACRSGLGGTMCLWVVEGVEAPGKLSRRELCGDVDLDWL